MIARNGVPLLLFLGLFALSSAAALAQSQTTGRIAGTVKDQTGAVIAGAEATVVSRATGEERTATTDEAGNYVVSLLPPGIYHVTITANGFKKFPVDVTVVITETSPLNPTLEVGGMAEVSVTIHAASPLVQSEGPQLGRVVDSRAVSELPLATRNFTQILALSPGTAVDLPNNTAVGRNSQNISVNGSRTTQNNFQINGVRAVNINHNSTPQLAVPAPETIQEFKVQTSLYDATFGGSGGGNIQVVTKSGTNNFHGAAYEYFRNDALNANSPTLKAADVRRPVLQRNVFGGMLGGPLRKEKAFFFISYQGTRERNGASPNSLSSNVLIAPGLTDDRSEATLLRTFNPVFSGGRPATSIHPIALALLNVRLPDGQFLIPTPQANGRYSGSSPSRFREDQFNTNFDYRLNERDWLAAKFFFSNAPLTLELPTSINVPGFAADQQQNNRIISFQNVHAFSATVINEARLGYNFIRQDSFPREPVKDSDLGIRRANANLFPGLGRIRIASNAGGVSFGTEPMVIDNQLTAPSMVIGDILSITRGKHSIRIGGEVIYNQLNFSINAQSRGSIDFANFNSFLIGATSSSNFGTGLNNSRSLRSTDYNFFVHDDWKVSPRLTLNLGLRYELALPPYDTRGRLANFDPALYKPQVGSTGNPVGPPLGGFVQAGNVIAQYNLPDLPKVDRRMLNSIDPNNFGPRLGFAYSPRSSGRLVVRGGYGIFYSRYSYSHVFTSTRIPPNYILGRRTNAPFADPFFATPPPDQFPTFVTGIELADSVYDPNLRTPYLHQYNTSVQYAVAADLLLEVAYVGTRGLNLFRTVALNQARLASPDRPVINEVPGQVITTNTLDNAPLRAPFQGLSPNSFGQIQSTAQSSYNSLQMSLTKRLSQGLQFLAAYTYAKSIDNTSGGSASVGTQTETAFFAGNQFDNRANRGVSNFDRTHRFVLNYLWDLPQPAFAARSRAGRGLLSDWQVAGIIIAMSGLPIDITDSNAGSFYGLSGVNIALARPNYAPGATRRTATSNIPSGYFFNPFAFARPIVLAGQPIPSSNGAAIAGEIGTDIGNVGRNVLRGPRQINVDFSIIKRFRVDESKNVEFRAEFFNLFNHVNLANPISNLNAIPSSGGSIDPNTGQIINPSDFGRIISTSNNPRIIQLALKFNF